MKRALTRLTRLGALLVIVTPLAVALAGPPAGRPAPPNDPHGKFRGNCADCHDAKAWTPARIGPKFDHATFGFPLEGAHAAANCRSCHASLDFTQERQLCASCHEDVHRGEFGSDCASCHSARSFIDRATMVRRHQVSRFPLTGGHAALECEDCHRPATAGHLRFVGTQADCGGCHMKDFQAAKAPDHVAGNFPLDCLTCHTTATWGSGRFNHDATSFPLTGAHRTAACASCHGDGVYAGKSTACAACHQGDYDRTTNPAHAASGFSTQCATCHTTTQWAGAVFDHNATAFPLTGAHRTAACASCHGDGVYAGKSTACAACHQGDYDRTTDPPHAASGFATTCATCHNTTQWAGATFASHDAQFFPIYSGTHAGKWANCATCHTTTSDFAQFTCFSCHPHDSKTQTDSNHGGVNGYSYTSQACYSCHPRGRN